MVAAVPPYLDLLGMPFERGARGPDSYDCYGLAREMFRRDGIDLPDFESPGEVEEMERVISVQERRWKRVPYGTPKSIVTLRCNGIGSHVGYMIERDRFIHAFDGVGVTTERLTGGSFVPLGFYIYA